VRFRLPAESHNTCIGLLRGAAIKDCPFRGGENCSGTLRPRLDFGAASPGPTVLVRDLAIMQRP